MNRLAIWGLLLGSVFSFGAMSCVTLKRLAYEGFGRDRWQKPEAVVRALELQRGGHVADLGSGTGYFTFHLADAVGPEGRVYAVDVDESLVKYVERQGQEKGHPNVQGVLANYDDPLIPQGVDLIFTSNTFHHIQDRPAYFGRVKKYLRPGGRVAIVEGDERGEWWLVRKIIGSHSTPRDQIVAEMEAAGYGKTNELGFLETQSFLVFTPKTAGSE